MIRITGLRIIIIITIICSVTGLKGPRPDEGAENEDRDLNTVEIIRKYGYPAENHTVITDDGYILEVHRIPYGRLSCKNESKGVILLQHGVLLSSADFIIVGTKRGLGYILADEGYDVWLGNSRGNTYSRKHVKYTTEDKEFWDFTWHDMGLHDTPALIDYILNQTNQKYLIYIGYSQGTTSLLAMSSLTDAYNDKIKLAVFLAPVAYFAHTTDPLIHALAATEKVGGTALKVMTTGEFLPNDEFISSIDSTACYNSQPVTPEICKNVIFLIFGFDSKQLNDSMVSIIAGHSPAGCSVKDAQHYAQSITINKFRQYDYGPVENLIRYNQLEPPEYPLEKIQIPIVMFWALNDWLAAVEDVDQLTVRINHTLKEKNLIDFPEWNHLDYLYAIDMIPYLAEPLVNSLNRNL